MTWLLALLLSLAVPNPAVTPGDVDPAVNRTVACTSGTAAARRVSISSTRRTRILRAYGLPSKATGYTIDHLIPLELGGSNSDANLWPEPSTQARAKDSVENQLHRWVCRSGGQDSDLAYAQLVMVWWTQAGGGS